MPPTIRRTATLDQAPMRTRGMARGRARGDAHPLEMPLGPVSICPDGSGRCDPPTPGQSINPESALYITMAGPVAESWRTRSQSRLAVFLHNVSDAEETTDCIARICRRGWLDDQWEHRARRDLRAGRHEIDLETLAYHWYARDTNRLLKAARPDVERVAQALLARWRLSGEDVRPLIQCPPAVQGGIWVDR